MIITLPVRIIDPLAARAIIETVCRIRGVQGSQVLAMDAEAIMVVEQARSGRHAHPALPLPCLQLTSGKHFKLFPCFLGKP